MARPAGDKDAGTSRRRQWPFLGAVAVDSLGTGMYLPVSLLYLLRSTDLSLAAIGGLMSLVNVVSLPVPLAVGRLVDRFGPRLVVASGQALQGIGFLLYLTVSGASSLLLAVLVTTVGLRVYWSSIFTLVANQADAEGQSAKDQWFARTGMIREAGAGGGALIAGALLAINSMYVYNGLILSSGLMFLLAAAVVAWMVPSTPHLPPPAEGRSGYRALLRDRPFLTLIATCAIFSLCSSFLALSLPVYVVEGLRGPDWAPGSLLALNTVLLATCTAAVTGFVRRRCTRARAMAWAGALWVLWCAMSAAAALVPTAVLVPYLVVVVMCFSLAEMTYAPMANALVADAAPAGSRGTYMAAFQYSFACASIVAPSLFGLLFSKDRLIPWLAVGALALVGTVLMLRLEHRLPPQSAVAERSGRTRGAVPDSAE